MPVKKMYINGPIHRVEVRLVTYKYLNKKFAAKDEKVFGCFIAQDNLIYLSKEMSKEQLLHTFLHEVKHMLDSQLKDLPVEQQCDSYATWATNFYKIPNIESLFQIK